jgi:CBS domain containing-hemolysin-like protein
MVSGLLAVAVGGGGGGEAGTSTTWDWVLLWLYLLLALGVSFLCSMLEASLLTITPSYVRVLAERGSRTGRLLEELKNNIDRPLSAILTLNTVAHTVGAAGVGAQAAVIFGRAWVGITSAVLTFLILILSEIVPKTIGAVAFKSLAGFTAYTIQGMIWLLWPLVQLCMVISKGIAGSKRSQGLTRDEIASLARLGRKEGALHHEELRVMQNLLRLRQIQVKDVMTPRNVVYMVQADQTVGDLLAEHQPPLFARIPVYERNQDDLIGVVSRYEIMRAFHANHLQTPMRSLAQPLSGVPEHATVADALYQLSEKQQQFFQVVDEYGGTAGIITFEDAIESLLGIEIVDETDPVTDMRQLAKARRQQRFRQIGRVYDHTESGTGES